jgi:hypothetical protein
MDARLAGAHRGLDVIATIKIKLVECLLSRLHLFQFAEHQEFVPEGIPEIGRAPGSKSGKVQVPECVAGPVAQMRALTRKPVETGSPMIIVKPFGNP